MSPRQRLHPASPDVTRRFLTFAKSLARTGRARRRHPRPCGTARRSWCSASHGFGVRRGVVRSLLSVNDRVVGGERRYVQLPMSRLVGQRSASASAYCAGTASRSGGMPDESARPTIVSTRAARCDTAKSHAAKTQNSPASKAQSTPAANARAPKRSRRRARAWLRPKPGLAPLARSPAAVTVTRLRNRRSLCAGRAAHAPG